ncbi:11496_t:CDS:10, partial [Racocetra persica]
CKLNNPFIANFEKCKANTKTTFSLGLAEESTEDFEECEDNARTIFSLGLEYEDKVGLAFSLELGIVKDNSCIGSKVSEINTGSTFELKSDMDLELAKDKGGLGLEVKENSKGLVKSNGSINLDLELVESRSSVVSDFGNDLFDLMWQLTLTYLYLKLDDITELYIGLQFDSWEAAEYYIKEYKKKEARIYKPNKVKPSNQQHNKGSKKSNYEWHVNLSKHEIGMQSTQHVKLINVLIHKAVFASSSMANIVEALDSQIQQEAMNKSFMVWKYKSTIY